MSSDIQNNSQLFEMELALPDSRLTNIAHRLVGFSARYERLERDLQLLIDIDGMVTWSNRFYNQTIPIVDVVADRYPLVIFHGDVGTGKTITAEAISNTLAANLNKEAWLFKLSTRVRGTGQVGQMSSLINQAFEIVTKEVGKRRLAFLILVDRCTVFWGCFRRR